MGLPVFFGFGGFPRDCKQNVKQKTYLHEHDSYIDYHGLSNVYLPNSSGGTAKNFTIKRFVVIQMK